MSWSNSQVTFIYRIVEWLDEYHPGSFRQAQVSFSTRIPNAFPLGDAMTMSTNVCLYNAYGCHNHRDIFKPPSSNKGPVTGPSASEVDLPTPLPSVIEEDADVNSLASATEASKPASVKTVSPKIGGSAVTVDTVSTGDVVSVDPAPAISMVSKHSNGTLNLWQLTFADSAKFSQVLSIGHSSRASGHRFRVNDITCHPVLPLLLTTSHHNLSDFPTSPPSATSDVNSPTPKVKEANSYTVSNKLIFIYL